MCVDSGKIGDYKYYTAYYPKDSDDYNSIDNKLLETSFDFDNSNCAKFALNTVGIDNIQIQFMYKPIIGSGKFRISNK